MLSLPGRIVFVSRNRRRSYCTAGRACGHSELSCHHVETKGVSVTSVSLYDYKSWWCRGREMEDGSGGGGVAVDSVTSARVVMQLCRRHPRLSLILAAAAAADRVPPLLLRRLDHGKHGFHLPGSQYLCTASGEKQRCHCTLVP